VVEANPLSQPAERVQAEMFAGILRRELVGLKKKVAKAESDWQRRCEAEGYVEPPPRLVVVRERVDEATRMLDALNSRFLRAK
jgi:hypothetical protein